MSVLIQLLPWPPAREVLIFFNVEANACMCMCMYVISICSHTCTRTHTHTLQLCYVPFFTAELFVNFDCGLYCTNVFENLTKLLSKVSLEMYSLLLNCSGSAGCIHCSHWDVIIPMGQHSFPQRFHVLCRAGRNS